MPSRRPLAVTTGPPEEPWPSGAVCSTLPVMRRPRDPRKARFTAETKPIVTRRRPPGLARAKTAVPRRTGALSAPSAAQGGGRASPVSTATTGRSADHSLSGAPCSKVGSTGSRSPLDRYERLRHTEHSLIRDLSVREQATEISLAQQSDLIHEVLAVLPGRPGDKPPDGEVP
jgi:hypothetical protein